MADTTKCAHTGCGCMVSKGGRYGKYCSEHCREAADKTELRCDCKHLNAPAADVLTARARLHRGTLMAARIRASRRSDRSARSLLVNSSANLADFNPVL